MLAYFWVIAIAFFLSMYYVNPHFGVPQGKSYYETKKGVRRNGCTGRKEKSRAATLAQGAADAAAGTGNRDVLPGVRPGLASAGQRRAEALDEAAACEPGRLTPRRRSPARMVAW